jgi:hypothetical protein
MNFKTFFSWLWKAVYHGLIILTITIIIFKDKYLEMATSTYTALLLTLYMMLLIEVIKKNI